MWRPHPAPALCTPVKVTGIEMREMTEIEVREVTGIEMRETR